MSEKRKIQQMPNDGSYFLTIPKSLIRAKEWQKGQSVRITISKDGNLVLTGGGD